jgi:hypothetical protein
LWEGNLRLVPFLRINLKSHGIVVLRKITPKSAHFAGAEMAGFLLAIMDDDDDSDMDFDDEAILIFFDFDYSNFVVLLKKKYKKYKFTN